MSFGEAENQILKTAAMIPNNRDKLRNIPPRRSVNHLKTSTIPALFLGEILTVGFGGREA
jgi:hypothetical protein